MRSSSDSSVRLVGLAWEPVIPEIANAKWLHQNETATHIDANEIRSSRIEEK